MKHAPHTVPTPQPPFVAHCRELLAPLGAVRVRRMFGGWGLYVDGLFIAIIAFERLYLKTDATSALRFEAAGCEPFRYGTQDREVSLGYWTAPVEALDAPALMEPWARSALQAALAARAGKAGVKPTRRGASPGATKRRAPTKRARAKPGA